jgi:diguanylate cyclase (GGDEF)-like protein
MPAPTAYSEEERLEAVRQLDLLDMPPEPEFDELTRFAAAICEVPISIISLIDDRRQWYISSLGVPNRELPLERTFCQYTVVQDDLLVVEDTCDDERFATHPAVVSEPGVRFYAGISIHSPGGLPVGTLCVADTLPRQLSRQQLRSLRVLAHQANARLAMRTQRLALERALAAAREANARLAASEREVRIYQQELEAANQRLREMATIDSLTGLLNRRAFQERLPVEFAEARRHRRPLSVLLMDLDDFKRCNDRYGHECGDQVLTIFAHLLKNTVRSTDLLVRHGGEEFLVLLPNTGEADAMTLCHRILHAMRTAEWPREPVTASIGLASLGGNTLDGMTIVRQADEALYAAKRSGKNCAIHHNWEKLQRLHLA